MACSDRRSREATHCTRDLTVCELQAYGGRIARGQQCGARQHQKCGLSGGNALLHVLRARQSDLACFRPRRAGGAAHRLARLCTGSGHSCTIPSRARRARPRSSCRPAGRCVLALRRVRLPLRLHTESAPATRSFRARLSLQLLCELRHRGRRGERPGWVSVSGIHAFQPRNAHGRQQIAGCARVLVDPSREGSSGVPADEAADNLPRTHIRGMTDRGTAPIRRRGARE